MLGAFLGNTGVRRQPTSSRPSRALNTVFQPDADEWVFVSYPVNITTGGVAGGNVKLLADESNPPTTQRDIFELAADGDSETETLQGWIKPGWYVKIETNILYGVPSFSIGAAQDETKAKL